MAGYGRFTQIDLRDLSFLAADPTQPNREAARFGLELAAVAYSFDVDPWLDAGWTDISIQADEKLLTGVAAPDDAERPLYQRVVNEWVPYMARRHIRSHRRFEQVKGILWKPQGEEEELQTGKAITMIRPLEDGRWAVAIGFMGTGRRQVDWLRNFRFAHPQGFHEGFLEASEQFEENCGRIQFEQAARALGMMRLTLADVLDEAGRPGSRFVVFAAGHSQGAAVLQLWMWRQLRRGLRPDNVLGYGYAPPSVAAPSVGALGDLPLHLFSNSDDIVTRVGLYQHIGHSHLYHANDAFRTLCYPDIKNRALFDNILGTLDTFSGTQDSMRYLIAFVDALSLLSHGQALDAMVVFLNPNYAEKLLMQRREEPVDSLLRMLSRMMRRNYEIAMRVPANEELLRVKAKQIAEDMRQHGSGEYARALVQAMFLPHALIFRDPDTPGVAPYTYMVVRGFGELSLDQER